MSIVFILLFLFWPFIKFEGDASFLGSAVVGLLTLITLALSWGYSFTLPQFFQNIINNKPDNIIDAYEFTWQTAKRVFTPLISLSIIYIIVYFLIYKYSPIPNLQPKQQNLVASSPTLLLFILIQSSILPIFSFTPILFTLENKRFFEALVISVRLFFRHIRFTYLLVFLSLFSSGLSIFTKNLSISNKVIQKFIPLVSDLVMAYISLGILAALFFYYLDCKSEDRLNRVD